MICPFARLVCNGVSSAHMNAPELGQFEVMSQSRPYLPLGLIVLGLVTANCLMAARRSREESSRSYGWFTSKQILDRTEPLCNIVAPEIGSKCISISRTECANRRFWLVD